MSAVGKEWIAVLIFFLCFVLFTIGEAVWLYRAGWSNIGKSLVLALTTNIFSFCIGFFIIFIVFGVVLALAWDGSLEKVPGQDYSIGAALIAAMLFPFFLLTLSKKLLLMLLKIQNGKRAWLFSITSSLLILTTSTVFPVLLLYVF